MSRYVFLYFLIGIYSIGLEANEQSKKLGDTIELKYAVPVGEKYLSLAILRNGEVVRILKGEIESGGAFEPDETPRLSPGSKFLFLSQVESGEVESSDGSLTYHEVAYCNLVDVRDGCIVARETGQFCAGTFTPDGKWRSSLYPDLDLSTAALKSNYYTRQGLIPAESPITSFENLLTCDPPNKNNEASYRAIVKMNILNMDAAQRERLESKLMALDEDD